MPEVNMNNTDYFGICLELFLTIVGIGLFCISIYWFGTKETKAKTNAKINHGVHYDK